MQDERRIDLFEKMIYGTHLIEYNPIYFQTYNIYNHDNEIKEIIWMLLLGTVTCNPKVSHLKAQLSKKNLL